MFGLFRDFFKTLEFFLSSFYVSSFFLSFLLSYFNLFCQLIVGVQGYYN